MKVCFASYPNFGVMPFIIAPKPRHVGQMTTHIHSLPDEILRAVRADPPNDRQRWWQPLHVFGQVICLLRSLHRQSVGPHRILKDLRCIMRFLSRTL